MSGGDRPLPLIMLGVAAIALIAGVYIIREKLLEREHPIAAGPLRNVESGPIPDLGTDIVLAGSNTIGAHLADPLLEAFAATDGGKNLKAALWKAPAAWQAQAEQVFTTEKLKKCLLNAKLEQQTQVVGGRGQMIAVSLGSGCAAPLLKAGFANIGMASRPINDGERKDYADIGPWSDEGEAAEAPPRREHVIAMDGLVIIANKDVRPSSLSKDDVRRIFQRGDGATTWRAFGGPDIPIRLMSRDNVSGTYDTFKDLVLGGKDLAFDPAGAGGARPFSDTPELVEAVRKTPGAIGFAGLEYAAEHPDLVVPIFECGLDYAPVGAGAGWMIKTEDYPLARRLFLYTPETLRGRSQRALAFVDFVKSPPGQAAVEKAGFVSLEIGKAGAAGELRRRAAELSPIDRALANKYKQLTFDGTELTATIRFGFDEADLDARARDDLKRVADFMRQPANKGATLMAAGFADRLGPPTANLRKANERALAVAQALRNAGVENVRTISFGSEAPVGCNGEDDEIGRRKNRRVELWLLPAG